MRLNPIINILSEQYNVDKKHFFVKFNSLLGKRIQLLPCFIFETRKSLESKVDSLSTVQNLISHSLHEALFTSQDFLFLSITHIHI